MADSTKTHSQPTISANGKLREYSFATGHFMDIPVKLLDADPAYQRNANANSIRKIITTFTLDAFEPPTVSPRKGGRYAVIDGQNRVEAVRELGMLEITCRVVKKDAVKDEADVFVGLNRNRSWLTPTQAFKAEVTAEHPSNLEIARCLEERGLNIGGSYNPNTIAAAVAVKKVYSASGYVGLAEVLDVLIAAWPEDEPRRFSGDLIKGVHVFLQGNKQVDLGRLSERLGRLTARRLLALASQRWHSWRGLEQSGGSLTEATAAEIKKQYLKR